MNLLYILIELKVKVQRLHDRGILDLADLDLTAGLKPTHLGWEIEWFKPNRLTPWK